ncbi:MAG: IS6 family transposase [Archaeoglobi archaeon]|nr:IS6 family transposase [Candidatus Mnemosynella bozhongmuii]
MKSIKEIVKGLKIFERNKVPLEIKVLGIATYIQTSSVRRTAKILSELHPVSKSSVWNWIKKLEEKLPISTEKKPRNLVAIDETVVKANRKRYYVYAAIDVERGAKLNQSSHPSSRGSRYSSARLAVSIPSETGTSSASCSCGITTI